MVFLNIILWNSSISEILERKGGVFPENFHISLNFLNNSFHLIDGVDELPSPVRECGKEKE